MGLVLVVDPGHRQCKALERLSRDLEGHEIITVDTCGAALDLLETRLPDLVLFPLLFGPGDEARLQARLLGLPTRRDARTLAIPLAACAARERDGRPSAVPPRWFYWFRPPVIDLVEPGNPRALALRVREEVQRALDQPDKPETEDRPVEPSGLPADPFGVVPASPNTWALASVPTLAVPAVTSPSVETIVIDSIARPRSSEIEVSEMAEAITESPVLPPAVPGWGTDPDWRPPSYTTEPPISVRPHGDDPLGRLVAVAGRVPRAAYVGASAIAVLLMIGASGRVVVGLPMRWFHTARTAASELRQPRGMADLRSDPEGAEVFVGGRAVGVTPLVTELPAGTHSVEFRYRGSAQTVDLTIAAGETVTERIEWRGQRSTGSLKIESQPAGADVLVDGISVGKTPLVVDDVAAGMREVELKLGANSVRHSVEVKAGRATTIDSGVYVGWLALFSSIELTVREHGRVLALDERNRVMLSAGPHELTLENRALGFRTARRVEITSGETTPESLEVPKTQLTVTAPTSAEVWVDGTKAGETPLVDWPIDIGTREVLVRAEGRPDRKLTVTATVQPVHINLE